MTQEWINKKIKECHQAAVEKGFYKCGTCKGKGRFHCGDSEAPDIMECPKCSGTGVDQNRNIGELLMLIVSELSEALEAHRKENYNRFEKSFDWHKYLMRLSDKDTLIYEYEDCIKDTLEDEATDVYIRSFDLCGYLGIAPDISNPENYLPQRDNIGERLLFFTSIIIAAYSAEPKQFIGCISDFICNLNMFCDELSIPIEQHIEAKMAYNKSRPHKHGKEY